MAVLKEVPDDFKIVPIGKTDKLGKTGKTGKTSGGAFGRVKDFFAKKREEVKPERSADDLRRKRGVPSELSAWLASGRDSEFAKFLTVGHSLVERYIDYEDMDDFPECSNTLDIYAEEATQTNPETNRTAWIESKNASLTKDLDNFLQDVLHIEDDIYSLTRTACKYGNDFEYLHIRDGGIVRWEYIPPAFARVIRVKGIVIGYYVNLKGDFTKYESSEFVVRFREKLEGTLEVDPNEECLYPWEVVHFNLGARDRWSIYGTGVLEPARWIWRRLIMLEDSVLIYRLQRAPARFVYYIDVGNRGTKEADKFMQRVRDRLKKKKYVDPNTSKLDMSFNPLAQDEDLFIPIRGGKRTSEVEVLGGLEYAHMDDIEYFQRKLHMALKVPRRYLGFEERLEAGVVLAQEDIRFARSVMRVQRSIRNGLKVAARVQLVALNINPDGVEFKVKMMIPSVAFEIALLRLYEIRITIADTLERFVGPLWILKNIFKFSDTDIAAMKKDKEAAAPVGGEYESKATDRAIRENRRKDAELLKKVNILVMSNEKLNKMVKESMPLMLEMRGLIRSGFNKKIKKVLTQA